jgi:hypothetical protein
MKKKMRFALERTTKTTVRYSELGVYADADSTDWKPVSETGHDMTVGYLYVKKAAFRGLGSFPEGLDVTIEDAHVGEPVVRRRPRDP